MKKRKISIEVARIKSPARVFVKDDCSPQDIISALSLFGDDGVRFHISVDDVEFTPSEQNYLK